MRPSEGKFVRIKTGLYQGDLGIVFRIQNDDRIYVKLIPRVDPMPKSKDGKKIASRQFMRFPQVEFNPKSEIFKEAEKKNLPYFGNRTFY